MAEQNTHTTGRIEVCEHRSDGQLTGWLLIAQEQTQIARRDIPGLFLADEDRERFTAQKESDVVRLAACWNACEDIPNPEAVPDCMEALQRVRGWIDERMGCDDSYPQFIHEALQKAGVR